MAANGTNQSLLMGRTRQTYNNPLQNSRAQAYGQASSPNTPYNNGDNNMAYSFQPTNYQPTGYSGQNPNLGRYVPPMMQNGNPSSWMNSGGYAYNTPQAYTGGYSGFPPQTMNGGGNSPFAQFMTQMNNPFTGQGYGGGRQMTNIPMSNTPQPNNDRGMMGGSTPARSNRADSFGMAREIPARSNLESSFGNGNRMSITPGMMNDGGSAWANFLSQYQPQPQGGNQVGSSAAAPASSFRGLPWGFGG